MNEVDVLPLFLLLVLTVAFAMGLTMVLMIIRRPRIRGIKRVPNIVQSFAECPYKTSKCYVQRPSCWMAVKNRSVVQVQAALGVGNPRPCSLLEGLAGDFKLFIAPPVHGWVLVLGSGLPDPTDDPDACYRFVAGLSRKLGQVQLFSASPVLSHHAWIRAERGKIERAYAWSGQTVWKQGKRTSAEKALGVLCPDYLEDAGFELDGSSPASNVEKVPMLAAKWSIDPGGIEEQLLESGRGIAGEWSCRLE